VSTMIESFLSESLCSLRMMFLTLEMADDSDALRSFMVSTRVWGFTPSGSTRSTSSARGSCGRKAKVCQQVVTVENCSTSTTVQRAILPSHPNPSSNLSPLDLL
jgi:hypothetical protein